MARFNNNMFQDGFEFEDFDRTGIMDPGMADVIEMRKEANEARDGATDQYTADVADFKNTQATEAEQGIASLPNAPSMPDIPTIPNIDYTNLNPTLFGYDLNLPDTISSEDFQFEDVDMTGIVPDVSVYTNPYVEVFTPPSGKFPIDDFTIENFVEIDPPFQDQIFDTDTTPGVDPGYTPPQTPNDGIGNGSELDDYPFIDPETGGDLVLVPGDPDNPVIVRDPETGDLPPGFIDGGGGGPPGTIPPEVYVAAPTPPPPPPPVINPYTGQAILNPYTPYELPMSDPSEGYTRPMDPDEFGSAPGMNQGGRVPMGNNNTLNSGLSRLPINLQNDTLTQVFQSGFRPRR